MAEWSNAPVLKTGNGLPRSRVQIPIPPPHYNEEALSVDKAFLFGELKKFEPRAHLYYKQVIPAPYLSKKPYQK